MLRFILRRILIMIPVVLGVLIIVFAVSRMSGDPVANILGADATEEEYEQTRISLGLDKPLPVQFFNYIKGIVTKFDFGRSYTTNLPVGQDIKEKLPISARLGLSALVIGTIIGVAFGVLCAVNQNSFLDYIITVIAMIMSSMPAFWLALMMMLLFAVKLQILPPTGLDSWKGWVMPTASLALGVVSSLTRTTRSSMLEVIRQDYIRTARSKGVSNRRVIFKHALKNAVFPVITVFGMIASVSVGGSVVVETVFTIPGLGSYMANAITFKDFPVIQGTVFILSLFVCGVNLLVDIAYGFADPRIRAKYTSHNSKKKPKEQEEHKDDGEQSKEVA